MTDALTIDVTAVEVLTAHERAVRAAAFIDAEGCFTIRKDGSAEITVTNTDRRLTDWFQAEYGGSTYLQKRERDSKQQPIWRWRVSSLKATRILLEIEPYLMLKREQAAAALESQLARTTLGPGFMADRYRARMHELNRRGIR